MQVPALPKKSRKNSMQIYECYFLLKFSVKILLFNFQQQILQYVQNIYWIIFFFEIENG